MATNGQNGTAPLTRAAKLRQLLAREGEILVCPGVQDGFTARIALEAGFGCLYMTGAGTTMSRLGMPDLGIATLNDMRDHAAMIAGLDPTVPVIADADTGYGGPLMVGRTVQQYMRAGVAGLHLEDQVQTKRCGHLQGKQLVSEEDFATRIKAAVLAREREGGDIVIIARTDALQGFGYDVAKSRLQAAIAAGADVAFLEGITDRAQGEQICRELAPTPCLFNCVAHGVSPELSAQEAKDAGYRVMILPALSMTAIYDAVREACETLKATGKAPATKANSSPKYLFEVCGMKDCVQFDIDAGGKLYSSGV